MIKISQKALIAMFLIGCLSLPVIGGIELIRFAGARPASNEGRIVFERWGRGISVMDADGKNEKQLTIGNDWGPAWSPDGKQIAFVRYTDNANRSDIYTMNADGSNIKQLTSGPEYDSCPSWSPDGKKIAFGRNVWEEKGGQRNLKSGGIYVIDADGSNLSKLVEGPWRTYNPAFSPDGRKIAFDSTRDSEWGDIYVMDADGPNLKRLTFNNNAIDGISWSPDGRKIAFGRYPEGGNSEIYVMNADGKNQVTLTNTPGIHELLPSFSPDGTKIAFSSDRDGIADNKWYIYVMDADGSNVQRLTDTPAYDCDWTAFSYGVEPAGKLQTTWGKIKHGIDVSK